MDAQGRRTSKRPSSCAASARRQDTLRRLAMSDERCTRFAAATRAGQTCASLLDEKTSALVRLGALVASDAAPASNRWDIELARAAGATTDELVGTLIAVAPTVGLARLVAATPGLALAAGYDIDSALEPFGDQRTASPIVIEDGPIG